MSINVLLLLWMGLILSAEENSASEMKNPLYGNAVVSKILRIDQTCTLYCDIVDFPPIIGQNMPVKINGLKASENIQLNQKIQKFLNERLMAKTQTPPKIVLENIQRGDTFCFLADITIDGNDLCELLIENGLAQKIIEVKAPLSPQPQTILTPHPSSSQPLQKTGYIASKSSKIFHRPGCSHAKRLDPAKAVTFATREEALKTGRQPCKTCNP